MRNNVCYGTNGVCVLAYDDYDRGQNVIDGAVLCSAAKCATLISDLHTQAIWCLECAATTEFRYRHVRLVREDLH